MDGGTALARRSRAAARPPRRERARTPIPSVCAARQTSVASPTGSAAASSISRCVCSGRSREPPQIGVLDADGQTACVGKREATGELRGAQATRQLQQGERVAAGLGDDAVANALVEPAGHDGRQQARGRPLPRARAAAARADRSAHARRSARARRRRAPPTRPAAVARRTRAPAPTRGRATARRRRRTGARCSSATSASRLSTASATRKRSEGVPDDRPKAMPRALRCGSGRASMRSSIGAHS